jgi:hypothetical protein
MVSVDLSALCPSREGCKIHFWSEGTHRADYVTHNDTIIMSMMVSRRAYSFIWALNQRGSEQSVRGKICTQIWSGIKFRTTNGRWNFNSTDRYNNHPHRPFMNLSFHPACHIQILRSISRVHVDNNPRTETCCAGWIIHSRMLYMDGQYISIELRHSNMICNVKIFSILPWDH